MTDKSILEHLLDLRRFLIRGFFFLAAGWIGGYLLYPVIAGYLHTPLRMAELKLGYSESLTAISIFEGFLLRMKTALISGVIMFLPFHIGNLFVFIGPAMKAREKRAFIIAVFSGSFLAVGAVLYSYYFIIPLSVTFLTSPRFLPSGTDLLLTLSKNTIYIVQFLLAGAVVFQVPVILCAMLITGIVSIRQVLSASRIVILGAFVCSAILTPPDVLSQVFLALPLIILYYVSAGIGYLLSSKKAGL